MNNLAPNYLVPYVLGGTLAIVIAVPFGLHKALKLAEWPIQERRRAVSSGAFLLGLWYFAALFLAWSGFYRGTSSQVPTLQFGLLLPVVVGLILFRKSRIFRGVVEAVPQEWIVGVQVYRVLGLIFLVLYAAARLPGLFAWPAGVGDVLVGLLAPAVAMACAHRSPNASRWLRAWNLFGIADLIVAVTTGFLTSPSRLQMFAFDAPNELISAFPLVMIPVFAVPLSILLHFASLEKLRQMEAKWQLSHPVLVDSRG